MKQDVKDILKRIVEKADKLSHSSFSHKKSDSYGAIRYRTLKNKKCDRSFRFTIRLFQRIKSETDANPHRYFHFDC